MSRDRRDGGFATAELVVGAAVAALVFAALAATMTTGQDREMDLEDVAASQEDLQSTMSTLLKDVRAAEPLWFETAARPEERLGMQRLDATTGARAHVRWRVDPPATADGRAALVRETVQLDPVTQQPTSVTHDLRLEGLDPTIPPFAYFTRDGTQVTSLTHAPYTECAARVMVTLRAAPLHGRRPLTLISQAELRNRGMTPWWCP